MVTNENDVFSISIANGLDDIFIWRFDDNEQEHIYFECIYDEREIGGYGLVKECTVMFDGMHMVLTSGEILHFYFNDFSRVDYKKLCTTLALMYADVSGVLGVVDK